MGQRQMYSPKMSTSKFTFLYFIQTAARRDGCIQHAMGLPSLSSVKCGQLNLAACGFVAARFADRRHANYFFPIFSELRCNTPPCTGEAGAALATSPDSNPLFTAIGQQWWRAGEAVADVLSPAAAFLSLARDLIFERDAFGIILPEPLIGSFRISE